MREDEMLNDTPFYVFDIDCLTERLSYLKEKLFGMELCYAVKANPFLTGEVEPHVPRLEICSEGEYDICARAGVPHEKMVISGVYKNPEFIEGLVEAHPECIFTAESWNQYLLIKELAERGEKTVRLMPRLTSGNQFGVNEDELIDMVREAQDHAYLDIAGVEYFSGTQKSSLKKTEREFNTIKNVLERVQAACGVQIEELEYGGGFAVEYFAEKKFDEELFLTEFCKLVQNYFPQLKITIELGRSIAASCGTYYTRVVDTKENSVGNYAIVDGGMHHLVYYGQTMAMKVPDFSLLPKRQDGEEKLWNICGALCTVNDILVKQLPLLDLKRGDCFTFKNAGAYCMCEGISLLLSRDLPQVFLKKGETLQLVRGRVKTSELNRVQDMEETKEGVK